MKIEEAIQQKNFRNIQHKAGLNLIYTASWFSGLISHVLKDYGITMQQFNILRILKGQKGRPAALCEVTGRMLDQMSNTSRIIDKLVLKGYVDRRQCPVDRRQVDLMITDVGDALVTRARETLDSRLDEMLGHVSDEQWTMLNSLLDHVRETQQSD